MEMSAVNSTTPIKSFFEEYSKCTTKGFDCGVLAQSLKRLNTTIHAIGNKPLTYDDYTISEMDTSWRMQKLTDDLTFGLDPNPTRFFSPYNLAATSRELGELGYKNTELIPKWFDKLDSMLKDHSTTDMIDGAHVPFEQAMFGGLKNYVPRHYIYQGFSGSEEFKEHVKTLIEYE